MANKYGLLIHQNWKRNLFFNKIIMKSMHINLVHIIYAWCISAIHYKSTNVDWRINQRTRELVPNNVNRFYLRCFDFSEGIWSVVFCDCGRFGLWRFRSGTFSVCGRFGLWLLRFMAVPVRGRCGLCMFRFVAVSVCGNFGSGRFGLRPA